jgi:hypothetical protein
LKKEYKQSLAQTSMIFADDDNDAKISFDLWNIHIFANVDRVIEKELWELWECLGDVHSDVNSLRFL